MATFVLVHGGWAGGWQWRDIPARLRSAGHTVYTPTLTGMGERVHLAHPDIDLDTHITDIVNVIEFEQLQDVVLVGYSYSGAVVTGVADRIPERIAHLVYLDAFVPGHGQSLNDLLGDEIVADMQSVIDERGDGWLLPYIRYPDGRWVDPRVTPQPAKPGAEPLQLQHSEPPVARTYIFCSEDKENMRVAPPLIRAAETARSDRAWNYYELPTDHRPMDNMPEELAEILESIASDREGGE